MIDLNMAQGIWDWGWIGMVFGLVFEITVG